MDYLKIPHHSSDGSDLLLESLDNIKIFSNSITTDFRSSHLPKKEIMKKYKKNRINCIV